MFVWQATANACRVGVDVDVDVEGVLLGQDRGGQNPKVNK